MKFLLDASSTLQLIQSFAEDTTLHILKESFVLDLGKYEVGNALWKEHTLRHTLTEDEFHEFFRLLTSVILQSKILRVEAQNLPDVAKIAAKEKITFYDASYVQVATSQKLVLITEDARLAKTAAKYTKTTTTNHLQTNSH
jgi:predicted nucleic acid-binding protein